MILEQDLTALVSSRICHDLISPIGAISNGVELLCGDGAPQTPELGLIGDSVNSAAYKLRCFRIAFGAADPEARLPVSELVSAADAMFQGRSSVTFVGVVTGDLPRLLAKAVLLALLCQERCLPMGGRTEVTLLEDGFEIATAAPRLRDMSALWALTDSQVGTQKVIPAEVQFPLLGQVLSARGLTLERVFTEGGIRLGLRGLTT